jgi:hypothetical protein
MNHGMRNAIKNLPSGTKLFFEYMKCADKDNVTYSLHGAEFVLK